jgi:Mn-dependent DtxR family transcriptional regulator
MPLNKRHESIEDYLETILELSKVNPIVRSIDIAQAMNYSKPSISIAMKKLKERHYIIIDDNGYITLTEMGLTVAKSVLEKHEIISSVLIKLGVNEDIAYKDACRIEHDLSDETFQKIKEFYLNTIKK